MGRTEPSSGQQRPFRSKNVTDYKRANTGSVSSHHKKPRCPFSTQTSNLAKTMTPFASLHLFVFTLAHRSVKGSSTIPTRNDTTYTLAQGLFQQSTGCREYLYLPLTHVLDKALSGNSWPRVELRTSERPCPQGLLMGHPHQTMHTSRFPHDSRATYQSSTSAACHAVSKASAAQGRSLDEPPSGMPERRRFHFCKGMVQFSLSAGHDDEVFNRHPTLPLHPSSQSGIANKTKTLIPSEYVHGLGPMQGFPQYKGFKPERVGPTNELILFLSTPFVRVSWSLSTTR